MLFASRDSESSIRFLYKRENRPKKVNLDSESAKNIIEKEEEG